MNEDDLKTFDYRLQNIESQLTDLKQLIIDTKLQGKDIEDLQARVTNCEYEIKELKNSKLSKYKTIADTIFKTILTALVSIILVKLGIK